MKIYKENNEAIPAVIVQPDADLAPTGFTLVTSIVETEKFGLQSLNNPLAGWRDKKNVKDKLATLIYTKMQVASPADVENQTKWDLLSAEEKSIAVHWFIIGKPEFQLEVVNSDTYWVERALDYREMTMSIRKKKLRRMEALVFRRMTYVHEAKDVLLKMTQVLEGTPIPIDAITGKTTAAILARKLTDSYVEGIEGTLEDNSGSFVFESLIDFIDSRTGTSFQGNGFRNLTHSFRTGHTAGSVANEILTVNSGTW